MSLLNKLAEKALATLGQRGSENGYDKKAGTSQEERSGAQIARVFNELTGHQITTTDAWTFLQVLKMVRMENQIKTGSGDLLDSCNDMISYSMLKAETVLEEHRPAQAADLLNMSKPSVHNLPKSAIDPSMIRTIDTGNHSVLVEGHSYGAVHYAK